MMRKLKRAFGRKRLAKPLWHKLRHVEALWRWLGAIFLEQNEEHGEREHGRAHAAFDMTNFRMYDALDQMATDIEHQLALQLLLRNQALNEELLCYLALEGRESDVRELVLGRRCVSANAKDADGDRAIHLAAAHGRLSILKVLIEAGADLEARDHEHATPLVLACVNGNTDCTEQLLAAGARAASKWQYLTPIQWAFVKGHTACEKALERRGAVRHTIPPGRGETSSLDVNRLRPPPSRVARRRRKAASIKARPIEDGAEGNGEQSDEAWSGHTWVASSLLAAAGLKKSDQRFKELKSTLPGFDILQAAVRSYIQLHEKSDAPLAKLPAATVESFQIRPGIRLRKTDADAALQRKLEAAPTVNATWFGAEGAAPQFVSLSHDDRKYKYYFGELLSCFTFVHMGTRHECCYVRYLWPDVLDSELPAADGISLKTKYITYAKALYEILPLASVEFRAPLVRPPPLRQRSGAQKEFYVLNDDIYENF